MKKIEAEKERISKVREDLTKKSLFCAKKLLEPVYSEDSSKRKAVVTDNNNSVTKKVKK